MSSVMADIKVSALDEIGATKVLSNANVGDNSNVYVDERDINTTVVTVENGGTYVQTESSKEKWEAVKTAASDIFNGMKAVGDEVYKYTPAGQIKAFGDYAVDGLKNVGDSISEMFDPNKRSAKLGATVQASSANNDIVAEKACEK